MVIERKGDGTPVRFIGTHVDITENKKAEEELRETKETFSNSFYFSGSGKALIAPGGQWLEVNDVAIEVLSKPNEGCNFIITL